MTIKEFRAWWKPRVIAKADEAYRDRPPHWESCHAMTVVVGIEEGEKFWRKHREFLREVSLAEWTARVAHKETLRELAN